VPAAPGAGVFELLEEQAVRRADVTRSARTDERVIMAFDRDNADRRGDPSIASCGRDDYGTSAKQ
jgi:hypothetical protein